MRDAAHANQSLIATVMPCLDIERRASVDFGADCRYEYERGPTGMPSSCRLGARSDGTIPELMRLSTFQLHGDDTNPSATLSFPDLSQADETR